uniref:F-box domain containing protein n=1 Tax=Solanum tuberosum TaxID=4113 RepID=M1AWM3_SOLTU
MADWANLPNDLIAHIANRVKVIEDFIAFGAVCTSWRIAATKDNFDVLSHQVPFLMMADGDDDGYQKIYSLSKKKASRIFLPEVRGSKVVPIKEGWLCTVAKDTGEINLLHPFSRKKIHLPSLNALLNFHDCERNHWGCIYVAVLSANPSVTSDYVLMVLHYGSDNCLAFWRPGDLNWTNIDVANNFPGRPSALVYHKGEFYSMRHSGKVQAHEVAGPNTSDQPIVKTRLVVQMAEYTFNSHVSQYYLVELSGALLLVAQFDKSNMDFPNGLVCYHTFKFKVHEVDITRVCTSWRIAATKDNFDLLSPQVPFLMLADEHDDRYQEFYSLSKKKVSRIFLPEVRGSKCVSIKEGWLCTVVNNTGEMNLLHPFSRKKIHLPSQKALLNFHDGTGYETNHWGCINLVVLSANPSLTSDYILMVHLYGPDICLAFWRPGDLNWTHIDVSNFTAGVSALVYHKGKFYSMSRSGKVQALEFAGPNTTDQPIVKTLLVVETDEYTLNPCVVEYYLVELSGALLLVIQFAIGTCDGTNHTTKFRVYEVDITRGELKEEMKTLGNSSMFLGHNWASCIDTSKYSGVKPNHIYFADKWLNYSSYLDMSAYNFEDGKIESFYPGPGRRAPRLICPPPWVTPSLMK